MTKHVPKIPRKSKAKADPHELEKPEPISRGTYKGKIIEFREPRQRLNESGQLVLALVIEVVHEGIPRRIYEHLCGYIPAIMMIYRNRHLYIGMEVDVKINIREYQGNYYNYGHINWPDTDATTDTGAIK